MKILVTGASGFIGGHLIEELNRRGYDLIAMVRKTSNTELLEELGVELRIGDLTDPPSLLAATKGVESIVHLAAYYTFHGKKRLYEMINVEGTRYLLESALNNKISHFLYCSTTEVIGPVDNLLGNEETPPNPTYEYGKSKLKVEQLIQEFGQKGLNYTIIRSTGIYGPRNIYDVSYWFITSFMKNSMATRIVVGNGENYIQFVHISDLVQGIVLALEKSNVSKGQTYIISDERAYTYNELNEIMAEICGRKPPGIYVPPIFAKVMIAPVELFNRITRREHFLWHIKTVDAVTQDRAYSIDKAKLELGYQPKYDLKMGLQETVEWYRSIGI